MHNPAFRSGGHVRICLHRGQGPVLLRRNPAVTPLTPSPHRPTFPLFRGELVMNVATPSARIACSEEEWRIRCDLAARCTGWSRISA